MTVTATASDSRGGPGGLTLGLLGGGGAMFIGAGVTGLLGSMANKEAEQISADFQVAKGAAKEALRAAGQAKTDEYNQMSTISIALLGISVPVLGYGIYRFVSASADDASADGGAESTATVTPIFLREGGGAILLNGSF